MDSRTGVSDSTVQIDRALDAEEHMKVAIPSDDRSTIASHFGKAAGFLIYKISDQIAELQGYRTLDMSPHACACGSDERPSRHERVLDVLAGCKMVIARGMGAPMYDDLVACGIDVALTTVEDAQTAVKLFVARSLPERPDLGCETSH